MDIVEGIRKYGFRKWYERRLVEAHVWLVTGFLALILAFALFEVHNATAGQRERLLLVAAALASCGGGLFAWWQYRRVLFATEAAAELASCPHCGAFGSLSIVRLLPHTAAQAAAMPATADQPRLTVRCRRCQGTWEIDPPV